MKIGGSGRLQKPSIHKAERAFYSRFTPKSPIKAALGWAGGDQGMHLRYGAEGIADSEFLKALEQAARKAHAPIIKALS